MRRPAVFFLLFGLFGWALQAQTPEKTGYGLPAQEQPGPLNAAELHTKTTFTQLSRAIVKPEEVFLLDLSGQGLKEFPNEILLFKNLQVLDLSDNKISDLPPEFGQALPNLQELNLFNNRLEQLPKSIGKLRHLEILYLARNRYLLFPREMVGLKRNLRYLDISQNPLPDTEITWIERKLPNTRVMY